MSVSNLAVVPTQEEVMNADQVELDARFQKTLEIQKKKKRKKKRKEPVGDAESAVGPVLEDALSTGGGSLNPTLKPSNPILKSLKRILNESRSRSKWPHDSEPCVVKNPSPGWHQ